MKIEISAEELRILANIVREEREAEAQRERRAEEQERKAQAEEQERKAQEEWKAWKARKEAAAHPVASAATFEDLAAATSSERSGGLAAPSIVLDRPSPDGLGGKADWRPHTTQEGLQPNLGSNPLLGHSGLEGRKPVLAMTPTGPDSAELAMLMNARVTPEQAKAAWDAFVEVVKAWLEGWRETQTVEVEVDQAVRDENGNFVYDERIDAKTKRTVKTVRREMVKEKRVEPVPQPDREELLRRLGIGRLPPAILQMARQVGGLQALVWQALNELHAWPEGTDAREDRINFTVDVAGSMVQMSHRVFPDLQAVYDYTDSRAWTSNI